MKQHFVVTDTQGQQVAEFTLISTHDELQPRRMRYLYGGPQGGLLVIRYVVDKNDTSSSVSFESVATGELLEVTLTPVSGQPHDCLIEFGSQSVTFPEDQIATTSVRNQIAALGLTQAFSDVLEKLTSVGLDHGVFLSAPAAFLHSAMFWSLERPPSTSEGEGNDVVVQNFDPGTTPPTTFEAQFGQAYFE